jgi:hypothetical protein
LSASSLDLGGAGRFDVASVRRIDARDRVWNGIAAGAVASLLPAAFVSFADCLNDACSGFWILPYRGWAVVAAGAAVGAAIDAGKTRLAYRRTDQRNASRVEWTPVIGNTRRGVQLSVQF